ncbi:hypothetical protein SDJN02_22136, partial [Cucurbita argyrosperma subsp. argyrosperma]
MKGCLCDGLFWLSEDHNAWLAAISYSGSCGCRSEYDLISAVWLEVGGSSDEPAGGGGGGDTTTGGSKHLVVGMTEHLQRGQVELEVSQ